jgi:hypothetical protein
MDTKAALAGGPFVLSILRIALDNLLSNTVRRGTQEENRLREKI